jgi:ArsR family transcriptional regulator
MEENYHNNAHLFKALSDENRLRILEMLRNGEKCACLLLERMDITQPTLSHHMRILCDSGIVVPRKSGKWIHYSIRCEGFGRAAELLRRLATITPKECCEEDCC